MTAARLASRFQHYTRAWYSIKTMCVTAVCCLICWASMTMNLSQVIRLPARVGKAMSSKTCWTQRPRDPAQVFLNRHRQRDRSGFRDDWCGRWAIEIKRSTVPSVFDSFNRALDDVEPTETFVVYSVAWQVQKIEWCATCQRVGTGAAARRAVVTSVF